MKTLIVATKNKGKLCEIKKLLKELPFRVQSLADYSRFPDIVEDGKTFRANALKKSLTISRHMNALVLGEDSGIEVKALGNRPGVFSSRYSDPGATDKKNNLKMLRELRDVPMEQRQARYRCVMALSRGDEVIATVSGTCPGLIAPRSRGTNGFGYDPLFLIPRFNKTFGQLDPAIKSAMSHRARAMKKIYHVLARIAIAGGA